MNRRFQYALDPVLLTRQWALNALLIDLGESNELLAQQEKILANLQEKVNTAYAEWRELSNVEQMLSVERFTMHNRFIGDLLSQQKQQEIKVQEHSQRRDELIDQVVAAQKAVEAVEQHRDEMKAKFMQLRMSGDFKIADDQWNTILAGVASNGA